MQLKLVIPELPTKIRRLIHELTVIRIEVIMLSRSCVLLGIFITTSISAQDEPLPAKIDFNTHIRPIFTDKCFACHGPDARQRKGKFRLDLKEDAFKKHKNGFAVVPGNPGESLIVARINHQDLDERMPPPETNKPLTPGEIKMLEKWIEQGAEWKQHWAYVVPQRPEVPKVNGTGLTAQIDSFILAKLNERGLRLSEPADRITLIRRLYFDLIGLPPTPAQVDAFVKDASPNAYEKVVDELLASPNYGERMAIYWLDLVRYADTIGYHSDNHRDIAPYRDYVIQAFNQNKKFDQFTYEQLAGDLLPESTNEQKIASGYNRLNQTTQEGGAQAGEYLTKYQADRVRNTSQVWLGATMGCAECHDHKYDPISSRDFYSFAAFFADLEEAAVGQQVATLKVPDPAQEKEMEKLTRQIEDATADLAKPRPHLAKLQEEWEGKLKKQVQPNPPVPGPWSSLGPFAETDFDTAFKKEYGPEKGVDLAREYNDGKVKWTPQPNYEDGKVHAFGGVANSATFLYRIITVADQKDEDGDLALEVPVQFSLGSDDSIEVWLNGKKILSKDVKRAPLPDQDKVKATLEIGENRLLLKICNGGGGDGFYFRVVETGEVPNKIAAIIGTPMNLRTKEQTAELAEYFKSVTPELAEARKKLDDLKKEQDAAEKAVLTTMVSKAKMDPRPIRILPRGNWMDSSGEIVQPAVPAFMKQIEKEGRADRLDLAKWIMDSENPLPARVFVNRLWKLFFGRGLSKRLDDLGGQGHPPTHPELLDWLAVEFRDGWDMKKMVKLLLMTDTYRQTSQASAKLRANDPNNGWYARQAFFRLDAEVIRDNALAISGLLVRDLGGKSVKPYQPVGYWQHLNFPRRTYMADTDKNGWRRGLYTYWQRSFLHPMLLAFDAPSREECTAERPRSDTPQQALVLMNDPTFVEAARVFADRILKEGGKTPAERIKWTFREVLSREISPAELAVMEGLVNKHISEFTMDPEGAKSLVSTGMAPVPADVNVSELAAWTSIARTTLNLYEANTRY